MSTAHDKALEILEERDMNLTEEDVKEIERLSKSLLRKKSKALPQLFERSSNKSRCTLTPTSIRGLKRAHCLWKVVR